MPRKTLIVLMALAASTAAMAFAVQTATVGGTIKAVSADGKKLTVTVGSGASAKEESFQIGTRTQVSLDGKTAKLAEFAAGTSVTVSYDKASKTALSIRARGGEAKSSDKKPGKTESKAPTDSATPPTSTDTTDLTKDVAPKSTWTTNLAQMKIPDGRVSGTVFGQDFVLDNAKLNGGILNLRQGKEFSADAEITVFLFLKEGEQVAGKKFRVEAREAFNVPHIHANSRPKGEARGKSDQFLSKYAMILEFGRSARGQLPGKIYLCLPDTTKSVVAGHFSVEVFDTTHPLATESLISGKLTVRGSAADLDITLACVGKNQEGKMESPGGGFKLGSANSITSTTWAPRFSTIEWDEKTNSGAHKHVNRPPGHYLVYVRGNKQATNGGELTYEGYYDWKWVELKDADSKITADLVIDPANAGTLEISVSGETKEKSVTYVPLDADGNLPLPEAAHWLQHTSGAKLDGGKAVIGGLREGKYYIALGPWDRKTLAPSTSGTAEVKRGQTTKVELTAP